MKTRYLHILGVFALMFVAACTASETADDTKTEPVVTVVAEIVELPSIVAEGQGVDAGRIHIESLYLDEPGYVVIHKVVDGKPGPVVGNSELLEGENLDVVVELSDYEDENELIAMLHYDDGDGNYEFPGDDNPITLEGNVVLSKFTLNKDVQDATDETELGTPAPGVDPDTVVEKVVVSESETVDPETAEEAIVSQPKTKEFTITAKRWDFTPDTITVNEGDTVKLSIESIDVTHGFAITQFGVSTRLTPGTTTEVEFVADKAGTYTFFCIVQCGAGHSNMNGKLIVE